VPSFTIYPSSVYVFRRFPVQILLHKTIILTCILVFSVAFRLMSAANERISVAVELQFCSRLGTPETTKYPDFIVIFIVIFKWMPRLSRNKPRLTPSRFLLTHYSRPFLNLISRHVTTAAETSLNNLRLAKDTGQYSAFANAAMHLRFL
jgi:hypothetical protein